MRLNYINNLTTGTILEIAFIAEGPTKFFSVKQENISQNRSHELQQIN